MGDPYKGKVAGHALKFDRAGHSRFSMLISSCECGASIGKLSSMKQARAWHRQHKGDKLDDFVARGSDDRGREVHL